ncbi:MAG: alpha/beta fold hydrolase [Oligoflexus sp.]
MKGSHFINETLDLILKWEARGWTADSRWLYERLLHRLCCDAFPRSLIRSMMAHIPTSSVRLARIERGLAMDMRRYLLQDGGYDFRAALLKMKVPAIPLAGEKSQYFLAAAIEWMLKVWPQSEFHLFLKSGHGFDLRTASLRPTLWTLSESIPASVPP